MGILNTIMKGLIGDGGQSEGLTGYAAALGNPNGTFSGASGNKGVGGLAGWVKNNSKLLSQYLAAAGMDAAEGGGLGKNFNSVTMQQNSSDSMTQLLTKLLGGGMPGVEAKIGDKGLSINVARGTTGIAPIATPGQGATAPADAPATPAQPQAAPQQGGVTLQSLFGGVRPFSADLSGVSASDLVGLSPELILQALQLDQGQEQINDQKYRDIVNAHYNMGMLSDAQKRTSLSEARLPIEQMGAETDRLNTLHNFWKLATADERTPMMKEYEYAQEQGYKGNLEDWKVISGDPETIKLYKASIADGSFTGGLWDFIRTKAMAGATSVNINNKVEEDLDRGYIKSRLQMYDPTAREAAINAELKKMNISDQLTLEMGGDSPEAIKLRSDYIDRAVKRIVSAGNGRIIKSAVSADGSSIGWLVEWTERDGTKKEEFFRHALR